MPCEVTAEDTGDCAFISQVTLYVTNAWEAQVVYNNKKLVSLHAWSSGEYAFMNTGVPKCMKQILEPKGEILRHIYKIVEELSSLFSIIDKSSRQEINKGRTGLDNHVWSSPVSSHKVSPDTFLLYYSDVNTETLVCCIFL